MGLLDCANENCYSVDWRRFPTNCGAFGKLKCPSPQEFTISAQKNANARGGSPGGRGRAGRSWFCLMRKLKYYLKFVLFDEQKPAKKFLKQGINVRYISGRLSHNSLSTESPLLRSPFSEGRGACAQAISNNSSIKIKDTTQVLMTSSEDFVISNTAHVLPQNDIFLSSVRREFQLSFLYSFKILKFPKKHF